MACRFIVGGLGGWKECGVRRVRDISVVIRGCGGMGACTVQCQKMGGLLYARWKIIRVDVCMVGVQLQLCIVCWLDLWV